MAQRALLGVSRDDMSEESVPVEPHVVHVRTCPKLLQVTLFLLLVGLSASLYLLQSQRTAVRALEELVGQQSARIDRLNGHGEPIQLTTATDKKLKDIEQVLVEHAALLQSPEQVQTLTQDFKQLVDGLPAWLQVEAFHRILPARWQLEAYGLLHRSQPELPGTSEELQRLIDGMSAHALNRPQNAPEHLEEVLLKRSAEAGEKLKQIDEVESAQRESTALRQSVQDRVTALKSDLSHIDKLPTAALKARLVADAQLALQGLQVAVVTAGLDDAELKPVLTALSDELAQRSQAVVRQLNEAQAELSSKYQLWALEKLRAVPELAAIESGKKARIQGTIKKHLGEESREAEKAAKDELTQVLIDRLSVIDTRLLDEAVGEWYRRVFSQRFSSLDEEHQLQVVQGFASSVKQTPETLP